LSAAERTRSTRVLYRVVSWTGGAFLTLGALGTIWAIATYIQVQNGPSAQGCCSDLEKASLGGILASMFFVLIGSGVVLLLHPIRAHIAREAGKAVPRWLGWMALALVAYSVAVFALATVLAGMAEELEGFAGGIVTYCMLVGIGMLTAAWGFKRASEVD
jgi:hypothetical protein